MCINCQFQSFGNTVWIWIFDGFCIKTKPNRNSQLPNGIFFIISSIFYALHVFPGTAFACLCSLLSYFSVFWSFCYFPIFIFILSVLSFVLFNLHCRSNGRHWDTKWGKEARGSEDAVKAKFGSARLEGKALLMKFLLLMFRINWRQFAF